VGLIKRNIFYLEFIFELMVVDILIQFYLTGKLLVIMEELMDVVQQEIKHYKSKASESEETIKQREAELENKSKLIKLQNAEILRIQAINRAQQEELNKLKKIPQIIVGSFSDIRTDKTLNMKEFLKINANVTDFDDTKLGSATLAGIRYMVYNEPYGVKDTFISISGDAKFTFYKGVRPCCRYNRYNGGLVFSILNSNNIMVCDLSHNLSYFAKLFVDNEYINNLQEQAGIWGFGILSISVVPKENGAYSFTIGYDNYIAKGSIMNGKLHGRLNIYKDMLICANYYEHDYVIAYVNLKTLKSIKAPKESIKHEIRFGDQDTILVVYPNYIMFASHGCTSYLFGKYYIISYHDLCKSKYLVTVRDSNIVLIDTLSFEHRAPVEKEYPLLD
jgi:hypothetical protein